MEGQLINAQQTQAKMGSLKRNKAVQKAIAAGRIEWHMWANVLAVLGSTCLILGGVLGLVIHYVEGFGNLQIFIGSLALGLIIFLMEWPRGARKSGRTMPRGYQAKITPMLIKFGVVWSNLLFRSIFYILVAVGAFFELATIIGGLVMMLSSLVYIVAAFKKEVWKPLVNRSRRAAKGQMIAAPTTAPPRRPDQVLKNKTFEKLESSPRAQPRIVPTPAPMRAPPKPASRDNVPKRPPPQPSKFAGAWEIIEDESSGKQYYFNSETNETTWDRPRDLADLRNSSI